MDATKQTEDELETFRRQWKEEVQAKSQKVRRPNHDRSSVKQSTDVSRSSGRQDVAAKSQPTRLPLAHRDDDGVDLDYHRDVDGKESGRKVGNKNDPPATAKFQDEPKTALEYYEKAAEKEGQGRLGDSLADYRKAFKLDAKVHEKYKNKYFPPTKAAPQTPIVPETSINDGPGAPTNVSSALPIRELIASFANCSIEGEAPPTEFSPSPPCPIANIPEEVLVDVLIAIARKDLPSLVHISQTSKRLAYLTSSEDTIWRDLIHNPEYGIPAMIYDYTCSIDWQTIIDIAGDIHNILEANARAPLTNSPRNLPLSSTFPTYRHMFRTRPRIRFNGCYISTVNYTRPGGVGTNSLTWNHNVLIVTYYRYLRFFRDGSVITLLTTAEPADVVPYLQKEYVRYQSHGGGQLPQIVMKDALKGRWRLSGDPYGVKALRAQRQGALHPDLLTIEASDKQQQMDEPEMEGDVHIETEGVVSKYKYIMQLRFSSAGKTSNRSANNKLNWVGYWCHNKLTDDVGEFGMKNYRPYFWSRVRSWY